MRLALKPYVTTGVAIVGASVIAVTPITPSEPEAQHHNVALSAAEQNLEQADAPGALPDVGAWPPSTWAQPSAAAVLNGSSFVNPITRWIEVLGLTGTRLGQLGAAVLAEPAPILRQIIENQVGYGKLIATALKTTVQNAINLVTIHLPEIAKQVRAKVAVGDIMGAGTVIGNGMITVAATLFPLLDIMKIPNRIIGNVAAVMDAFTPKSFFDLGLIGQAGMGIIYTASGYVKFGAARIGQNLYDAVQARDMVKLLSTIINAPADIVGGILNGVYVPPRRPGGTGYWTEGLLTAKAWAPLHAFLVDIPRAIAAAIAPRTAIPAAATQRAPEATDTEAPETDGDAAASAPESTVDDASVTSPSADGPEAEPVVVDVDDTVTETEPLTETDTVTEPETGPAEETPGTDVVDDETETETPDANTESGEGSEAEEDTSEPQDSKSELDVGSTDDQENDTAEKPRGISNPSNADKPEADSNAAGTNSADSSGGSDQ